MPGFLVNRMLGPFINEAVFALWNRPAAPRTSTPARSSASTIPWARSSSRDFIGNDVMLGVLDVLYRGFGDPKFRAAPLLRQMVTAGHLGRKTGRGFYTYDEKGNRLELMTRPRAPRRATPSPSREEERTVRDTVAGVRAARARADGRAARRGGALSTARSSPDGGDRPRRAAVPGGYGGAGMGTFPWAVACEEIAAADMGMAVAARVHILAQLPILSFGTDEQKDRFLPPMTAGASSGAFALTEPGAGSDAAALSLLAERDR